MQTFNTGCDFCKNEKPAHTHKRAEGLRIFFSFFHFKFTLLKVWVYGIIFITIINLSSVVGAILIPCSKKKFYKKILMFLIALAIGTLSGRYNNNNNNIEKI